MKKIIKTSLVVACTGLFLGLTVFGVSLKIETKPATVSAVDEQCVPSSNGAVKVSMNFTTLQGSPNPKYTNGTQILNNVIRDITTTNGTAIVDPTFSGAQNFFCRSGNNKIECFGNHISATQRVHGTITLQGATFTGSNTVSDSMPVTSYGATGMDASNADNSADTLTIINPTTAEFKTYYNEPGDSFVLYYSRCTQVTPACTTNADCGTNGFTGSLTCQNNDVYQGYKTYTCNNPGTTSSYCSNNTVSQLKQMCAASQACSTGGCYPETW
ncbi:MAG: hypothetical protein EXS52_00560 [Candidatus Staskawiczbacteria bacterium]|nr:hypothetical protein [Candidatus Staskawiczbacteria bacterium]